jgi:uncharacterized membrane protein YesL
MRDAVDVFWETARDWYNGMVGLVALNLFWTGLSLTVILLPPALAGMYVVTGSIASGTGQRFEDFVQGARRYAWQSYGWALANGLVAGVFLVNYRFYGSLAGPLGLLVQVALGCAGLLWVTMQFYVWPFLVIQEQKRLLLAWKNALFLTLANPIYSLLLLGLALTAVVFGLLLILPLAVFSTSFVALLGSRAVRERLYAHNKLAAPTTSGENHHE